MEIELFNENSEYVQSANTLYDPDAARRCMASQDRCSGRFLYLYLPGSSSKLK